MSTVRSSLGEHPVPKPKNQGSSTSAHVQKPRNTNSNGNSSPSLGDQSRRTGKHVKPQGGKGTGARKGNSLPR